MLGYYFALLEPGWNWYPFRPGYFSVVSLIHTSRQEVKCKTSQVNNIASVHVEKTTFDRLQRCQNISNSVSRIILFSFLVITWHGLWGSARYIYFSSQLIQSGMSADRISAKACFDWYMQKVRTKSNILIALLHLSLQ
jgi:hypothetical protein